jgi:hypothetical protein
VAQQLVIPEDAEPYEVEMPTGMPRPLSQGKPVPWTARFERNWDGAVEVNFSATESDRYAASYRGTSCSVCGEANDPERVAVIATSDRVIIDGASMHVRCARLAHRHCPHLAVGYTIWVGPDAALAAVRNPEDFSAFNVPDEFVPLETRRDDETIRYPLAVA